MSFIYETSNNPEQHYCIETQEYYELFLTSIKQATSGYIDIIYKKFIKIPHEFIDAHAQKCQLGRRQTELRSATKMIGNVVNSCYGLFSIFKCLMAILHVCINTICFAVLERKLKLNEAYNNISHHLFQSLLKVVTIIYHLALTLEAMVCHCTAHKPIITPLYDPKMSGNTRSLINKSKSHSNDSSDNSSDNSLDELHTLNYQNKKHAKTHTTRPPNTQPGPFPKLPN